MDCEITYKDIQAKYNEIEANIREAAAKCNRSFDEITIVAVSKTQPAKVLECAYRAGIRNFGENYVQEFFDKQEILAGKGIDDVVWHYIGHLQTNKVKIISPFVNIIHSVDSEKIAQEIDKRVGLANRKVDILLQVNTSGEANKSGCEPESLSEFAESIIELENINIKGLMTIGSFTDDEIIQRKEFSLLRQSLETLNSEFGKNWNQLSMGMTGDYKVAIDEGATIVRIGTALFGNRMYKNFG